MKKRKTKKDEAKVALDALVFLFSSSCERYYFEMRRATKIARKTKDIKSIREAERMKGAYNAYRTCAFLARASLEKLRVKK